MLGSKAKVCDRISGVDANSLYRYCMMQNLPMGYPVHRKESTRLAREPAKFSKSAHAGSNTCRIRRGKTYVIITEVVKFVWVNRDYQLMVFARRKIRSTNSTDVFGTLILVKRMWVWVIFTPSGIDQKK